MKDLYLSQWQNHIDDDREHQQQEAQVVLQLGHAVECVGVVVSLVVISSKSDPAHGHHLSAS
jgi:hypothetical protein